MEFHSDNSDSYDEAISNVPLNKDVIISQLQNQITEMEKNEKIFDRLNSKFIDLQKEFINLSNTKNEMESFLQHELSLANSKVYELETELASTQQQLHSQNKKYQKDKNFYETQLKSKNETINELKVQINELISINQKLNEENINNESNGNNNNKHSLLNQIPQITNISYYEQQLNDSNETIKRMTDMIKELENQIEELQKEIENQQHNYNDTHVLKDKIDMLTDEKNKLYEDNTKMYNDIDQLQNQVVMLSEQNKKLLNKLNNYEHHHENDNKREYYDKDRNKGNSNSNNNNSSYNYISRNNNDYDSNNSSNRINHYSGSSYGYTKNKYLYNSDNMYINNNNTIIEDNKSNEEFSD
jgi:chromosome segregation ATPase